MARDKLTAAHLAAYKKDPVKHAGKHADGGGLYLQVTEEGGLYWRYKYRLGGREKLFAIGTLDDYSLAEARVEHEKARKLVLAGDCPVEIRKQVKADKEVEREGRRTFRDIALKWQETMIPADAARSTRYQKTGAVKRLIAGFGNKDIKDVTVADLAAVLDKLEQAGQYSTRLRVQLVAVAILGYAISRGMIEHNVFLNVKFAQGFTSEAVTYEPRRAITDPEPFGKLLRAIDRDHDETELSRISLRLLALTAVRPGELITALWKHVDWRGKKLSVPFKILKSRTKRKADKKNPRAFQDFEVPLSDQAIAELRKLQKINGKSDYLFPTISPKSKVPHMDAAAFLKALQRMGYDKDHSGHGFRSSFSSMMNKERMKIEGKTVLRWPDQAGLIEVQLDHDDASTRAIYNRGGLWDERCELMQLWADRVDEMRSPSAAKLRLVA